MGHMGHGSLEVTHRLPWTLLIDLDTQTAAHCSAYSLYLWDYVTRENVDSKVE